jgi:hypothetical protein
MQLGFRKLVAAALTPSGLLECRWKVAPLADVGTTGDIVALAAAGGTSPPPRFGFAELVKCVATECKHSRSHKKCPECRHSVDDELLVGRKLREIDVNRLLRDTERLGLLVDGPVIHNCHQISP